MHSILKTIIYFLGVLSVSTVYSQKSLNGVYSGLARYQESYEIFEFDENGDFEYHEGSCLGDNVYGSGTYELKDDLLILNFNRTKPRLLSFHKEEIYISNNDSITIKIQFIDINDQLALDYLDIRDAKAKRVGITNSDGFIEIRYKREKEKIDLTFQTLGYPEYNISLNRNFNYNVKMFWTPTFGGVPIMNQIDSLEIHKSSRKELMLGNENWKTKTWVKYED